jgi:hypothetical protein
MTRIKPIYFYALRKSIPYEDGILSKALYDEDEKTWFRIVAPMKHNQ